MEFPPAVCVEPGTTLREVLERLKSERRGSVLVCQEGQLVGIYTERDALRLMAGSGELDTPIEQRMSAPVVSISTDDTVESAIARMSLGGYRRLPVVDQMQRPLGVLKVSSILHYVVQHFPGFVYNLPPMSDSTAPRREGA